MTRAIARAFGGRGRLLPLVLASLLASGTIASSAGADDRADFTARYVILRDAMDSREDKAIKALLTPDFQAVDAMGNSQSADDMISALALIPVDPSRERSTTVDSVTPASDGKSADVIQSYHTVVKRQGRDGADHVIEIRARSKDHWLLSGSKWLLQRTESQDMTILRDGIEVRHRTRQ